MGLVEFQEGIFLVIMMHSIRFRDISQSRLEPDLIHTLFLEPQDRVFDCLCSI